MVIDRYSTRKLGQFLDRTFIAQYYSRISETTFLPPVTLYRVVESSKKQDLTGGGRFQTKKSRNFRIYQSDLDQGLDNANLSFYPKTDDVIVPIWGTQYVVSDSTDKEMNSQVWMLVCQEATGPIDLILEVIPPFASNWEQITNVQWQTWLQPFGE